MGARARSHLPGMLEPPKPRSRPDKPAIAVDQLVKVYKTTRAVDGISFALERGSITGLLGGNGAGKTTTIAMIMGLVTPTSGTARVLGAEMPRERYRVLHRMNRSEEHTSELQSPDHLVCRLL